LSPELEIVLYQPQIPQNTGNVGRLCVGIEARLHLVHPLAFDTSEKAVRRAGLDYWRSVDLVEHRTPEAFWEWLGERRFYLYSAAGSHPYTAAVHAPGDALIFGCETTGLPRELVERHGASRIPCPGPIRSLNLANAVAIVAYEALRQLRPALFQA
jgi:tRNA (cytidine/uridine-2'-O-)-methyltransferase